jgi:hypothetical protein
LIEAVVDICVDRAIISASGHQRKWKGPSPIRSFEKTFKESAKGLEFGESFGMVGRIWQIWPFRRRKAAIKKGPRGARPKFREESPNRAKQTERPAKGIRRQVSGSDQHGKCIAAPFVGGRDVFAIVMWPGHRAEAGMARSTPEKSA